MSDPDARQIETMRQAFTAQKQAFRDEPRRPAALRKADLRALGEAVSRSSETIADAISGDFGNRSRAETMLSETSFVINAARHARRRVARWSRPKRAGVDLLLQPGRAMIERAPKGVVGIIAPWNYPFQLAMAPLVDALAAGCRVMLKPSELAPRTTAEIHRIVTELFAPDHVAVIAGGPAVAEAFSALPFDHLLFTGSTTIGRKVARAAAENLTPVTLELGGKSPAIVASDAAIADAAKVIAWGRFLNAGQSCIAPDYVLDASGRARAIADAVIAEAHRFYEHPESDPDYTSIISDRHFERLTAMLEEARNAGATVVQAPCDADAARMARKIPPTVVLDPPLDGQLMREEIFGPILPIVSVASIDDAVTFVNDRDRPLALYVFTARRDTERDLLSRTMSGGAGVNNTMLHYGVETLPFGGTGASGYGACHGEHGFRAFTHERAVFATPARHPSRLLAPPYGAFFKFFARRRLKP